MDGHPARADQPGPDDRELDRLHLGGDVRRPRRAARPGPERVRDVHPERRPQGVHRPRDADLPARPVAPAVGRRPRVRRADRLPRWVPLAVSGYHIRESGSDAVQEIAFTFANAIAYLDAVVARGVSIDAVAPTLFTFLSSGIELLDGGGEVPRGPSRVGEPDPHAVRAQRPAERAAAHLRLHGRLVAHGAAAAEQRRADHRRGDRRPRWPACRRCTSAPTTRRSACRPRPRRRSRCARSRSSRTRPGSPRRVDPLRRLVRGRGADRRRSERGSRRCWPRSSRAAARSPASSPAGSRTSSARSAYRQARAIESGETPVIGVNRFASPSDADRGVPHATRRARSASAKACASCANADPPRRSRALSTWSRGQPAPARTSCRRASRPSRPTRRSARSSGGCAPCSASGGRRAASDRAAGAGPAAAWP